MYVLGLNSFLDTAFKVGGEDVVQLFATFTGRWMVTVRESLDSMNEDLVCTLSVATCGRLNCYTARHSLVVVQIRGRSGGAAPPRIPCRESGALQLNRGTRLHRVYPRGHCEHFDS